MIDHASEMAAFVRVVDAKGFSAAAGGLGLTPSAVSKLVTRLETRLGVRLLQRTTRALHLTAEGEAFYAAARRIVSEIETLENQISGQSGTPHGLLRVTTSLAFSTHQLAPVIVRVPGALSAGAARVAADRPRDRHGRGGHRRRHPHRAAGRHQLHGAQDRRGQTPDLRRALLPRAPRHAAAGPRIWRDTTASSRASGPISTAGSSASTARGPRDRGRGRVAVNEGETQMQLALQGIGIVRLTRLTMAQAHPRRRPGAAAGRLLGRRAGADPRGLSAPPPSRAQGPGLRQFPDREIHAAALGDMSGEI